MRVNVKKFWIFWAHILILWRNRIFRLLHQIDHQNLFLNVGKFWLFLVFFKSTIEFRWQIYEWFLRWFFRLFLILSFIQILNILRGTPGLSCLNFWPLVYSFWKISNTSLVCFILSLSKNHSWAYLLSLSIEFMGAHPDLSLGLIMVWLRRVTAFVTMRFYPFSFMQ